MFFGRDFWVGINRGIGQFGRLEKLAFPFWYALTWLRYTRKLNRAKKTSELFIGPVYTEFGHILLHILPFLIFAQKRLGIQRITICLNAVYQPLFDFALDRKGLELILLSDQIGQYTPNVNRLPAGFSRADQEKLAEFQEALRNHDGFDLSDSKAYWHVFRNWQLQLGYQSIFPPKREKKDGKPRIMLFPRKKGAEVTANNGGPWDYVNLSKELLNYGEVVIAGHPALSIKEGYPEEAGVRYAWDNAQILHELMHCDLIITQHSGACILGDYFALDTLILFNGSGEIKGLDETYRFRKHMLNGNFYFARTYEEMEDFLLNRYKIE